MDSTALAAHSDALAAIVETTAAGTLAVPGRHRRALATATVWQTGVAVTAAHVFRRVPASLTLVGADGRTHEATPAGVDASTDIAVFRLPADAPPAVSIGDASTLKPGHFVVVVGRSAGGEPSASAGIVNRVSGPWETWLGGQLDQHIRLDGGLYDGLSGAPVVDARGAVIGVASAALSRSHGMVVPASTVTRVVQALLAHGHVPRPYLGIGAQAVAVGEGTGLLVTALADGGPAAKAGVLVGDILVSVAGQAASSLQALRAALSDKVGQAVQATVQRGGVPTTLSLTAGQWPAEQRGC